MIQISGDSLVYLLIHAFLTGMLTQKNWRQQYANIAIPWVFPIGLLIYLLITGWLKERRASSIWSENTPK